MQLFRFSKRKMVALLLLATMGMSGLVGCSSDKKATDTPTTTVSISDTTEPETAGFVANVPEKDYGGRTVTFLVSTETLWGYDQMNATEQNGEAVNDAIYMRNRTIEDRFNVTIVQQDIPFSSFEATVKKAVSSGITDYDVVLPRLNYGVKLAQEGMFLNVKDIPYLDLTQPYWDSSIARDLTLADKLFFLAGDIHMYANDATWILLFNKDLHRDLDLESIYDLVLDNKWTFSTFGKMLKDVTSDVNGDGKITHEDRVGFLTLNNSIGAMLGAAKEQVFQKTGEESIQLNISSDRFSTVYNEIRDIFNSDNKTLNGDNMKKWNLPTARMVGDTLQDIFMNNRALFVGEVTDCISRYKEMDTDFGVVPFPKYDEKQENYTSTVIPDAMVLSIPVTCTDPEMVGILLEAMAAESRNTVLPAYYDVTLQRKRTRDEESAAMLDIIFGNRIYQLGMIYDWAGVTSAVYGELNKDSDALGSLFAKYEAKANAAIEKTIMAYKEIGK